MTVSVTGCFACISISLSLSQSLNLSISQSLNLSISLSLSRCSSSASSPQQGLTIWYMSRIDNRHDHEPLCRLCVSTIELLGLCVHRTPILYTCRRVFCLFAHGSQADTRAYVHAHSCILVYMPTCMHACIILHTYIHTYLLTYLHTYIRTYRNYTGIHARTNNEFATVTCMSMLTHPQMYIHIHNLLYACLFAHMLTKLHECVRLITPAHKRNLSRSFVRSFRRDMHTHTPTPTLSLFYSLTL